MGIAFPPTAGPVLFFIGFIFASTWLCLPKMVMSPDPMEFPKCMEKSLLFPLEAVDALLHLAKRAVKGVFRFSKKAYQRIREKKTTEPVDSHK